MSRENVCEVKAAVYLVGGAATDGLVSGLLFGLAVVYSLASAWHTTKRLAEARR